MSVNTPPTESDPQPVPQGKWEPKDTIQTALTIIALVIGLFSLYQVGKNTEADEQRQKLEHAPFLQTGQFLAKSVDLTAQADVQEMERLQIRCIAVPTQFWASVRDVADTDPQIHYAFAFIANKGADRAQGLSFSDSKWQPAQANTEPAGWLQVPESFASIGAGECYALLLGVVPNQTDNQATDSAPGASQTQSPQTQPIQTQAFKSLAASNFENVEFTLNFADIYGNSQIYRFNWEKQGPYAIHTVVPGGVKIEGSSDATAIALATTEAKSTIIAQAQLTSVVYAPQPSVVHVPQPSVVHAPQTSVATLGPPAQTSIVQRNVALASVEANATSFAQVQTATAIALGTRSSERLWWEVIIGPGLLILLLFLSGTGTGVLLQRIAMDIRLRNVPRAIAVRIDNPERKSLAALVIQLKGEKYGKYLEVPLYHFPELLNEREPQHQKKYRLIEWGQVIYWPHLGLRLSVRDLYEDYGPDRFYNNR